MFKNLAFIPQKQFREWNKHLSRFIWDKKRPRVTFCTLQLPGKVGGMALLISPVETSCILLEPSLHSKVEE